MGILEKPCWWGPPLDAPPQVEHAQLAPGSPKRYLLTRELTVSSSAEVYLATDALLDREVVLKLSANALAEARALAQARHPHVIELCDAGVLPGTPERPYLVTPYCEAGTLRDWSHQRPWPTIITRILEVGQALLHCHARLLVHGDVKPSNILVTQGRAVLSDFGLTAAPDLVDVISGTPGYIAPELLEGRRSPSNDVFALACTAWMCLLGALPHSGSSSASLVLAAQEHRVEWPRERLSRQEGRVLRAVSRGLHPDQRVRPELRDWLEGLARQLPRRRWGACRPSRHG